MNNDQNSYSTLFDQRWGFLRDPDVRALAWLLDAPDLFEVTAPIWKGQIASLSDMLNAPVIQWLTELDQMPETLHQFLKQTPVNRLGKYTERLLTFFLKIWKDEVFSSVQMYSKTNETLGEFDFVFRQNESLIHWELATKIYLYKEPLHVGEIDILNQFIGPNQTDSLRKKLNKIFLYQLRLKDYPEAWDCFSESISFAQALLKGWLFYQEGTTPPVVSGISMAHCTGFWVRLSQWHIQPEVRYIVLPRLQWLAPITALEQGTISGEKLRQKLSSYFNQDGRPVLISVLGSDGMGAMKEVKRGFIVPDNW